MTTLAHDFTPATTLPVVDLAAEWSGMTCRITALTPEGHEWLERYRARHPAEDNIRLLKCAQWAGLQISVA